MVQQINLYVPELRPQRELLSARQAGVLALVFVAALALIQGVWHVRANNLSAALADRQAQVEALQVRVNRLKASAPAADGERFEQTIAKLQTAIEGRRTVRRIISGQNVGNTRGFEQALRSLARASQGDLALERFTLSRGGSHVEMRGRTRAASAVPLYLQRLREAPGFEQARFGLLSIAAEKDSRAGYEFALGYENLYRPRAAGGQP